MTEKKLALPHVITEFDDEMLVPLSNNFTALEKATVRLQLRADTIEGNILALSTAYEQMNVVLQDVVNDLTTLAIRVTALETSTELASLEARVTDLELRVAALESTST